MVVPLPGASMSHRRPSGNSWRVAALALAFGLTVGCKQHPARPRYIPGSAPAVLGVKTEDIKAAIATRVASDVRPSWVAADHWKRVRATYARYDNAPLWLEPEGVKDRATALL